MDSSVGAMAREACGQNGEENACACVRVCVQGGWDPCGLELINARHSSENLTYLALPSRLVPSPTFSMKSCLTPCPHQPFLLALL